jgi:hypothetical protein
MTITESEPVVPRALAERVKAILLRPAREWEVIDAEPATIAGIYRGYLMYIAAIGPLASFIGQVVFSHIPVVPAAIAAVAAYVVMLAAAYAMAWVIDVLAPSFGGARSRVQAFKVSAYSATAGSVAGIFAIVPVLAFLSILGLYGLYLLWLGLPRLMKVPQEKQLGYYAAVIVCLLLIAVVISVILSPLLIPRPI